MTQECSVTAGWAANDNFDATSRKWNANNRRKKGLNDDTSMACHCILTETMDSSIINFGFIMLLLVLFFLTFMQESLVTNFIISHVHPPSQLHVDVYA